MKKLVLAVALALAFAAPGHGRTFPNACSDVLPGVG